MPDLRSIEAIIFLLILFSGVLKWIVEKLIKLVRYLVEQQRRRAEQSNLDDPVDGYTRTDEFSRADESDSSEEVEWETVEEWEEVDPEVFVSAAPPPSPRRDVVRPSTMSASELREYLQGIPATTSRTEASRAAPPPPPEDTPEREEGDQLVHTESTQAYRVSTDAYQVRADAYDLDTNAYDSERKGARRHPLVGSIKRRQLREALIWREILDPPLCLRKTPPGHQEAS
ncbi:MAG: hypothetical protein AAF488_08025 [Planctomycetota bacterium]